MKPRFFAALAALALVACACQIPVRAQVVQPTYPPHGPGEVVALCESGATTDLASLGWHEGLRPIFVDHC